MVKIWDFNVQNHIDDGEDFNDDDVAEANAAVPQRNVFQAPDVNNDYDEDDDDLDDKSRKKIGAKKAAKLEEKAARRERNEVNK
jgi:outer membrane translocation and assembly module TamA